MSDQKTLEKFMQVTMEIVNGCLAHINAMECLLINSGVITKEELMSSIKDSGTLPDRIAGMNVLSAMLKETENEKIS